MGIFGEGKLAFFVDARLIRIPNYLSRNKHHCLKSGFDFIETKIWRTGFWREVPLEGFSLEAICTCLGFCWLLKPQLWSIHPLELRNDYAVFFLWRRKCYLRVGFRCHKSISLATNFDNLTQHNRAFSKQSCICILPSRLRLCRTRGRGKWSRLRLLGPL